jgi:hypothetical protein
MAEMALIDISCDPSELEIFELDNTSKITRTFIVDADPPPPPLILILM